MSVRYQNSIAEALNNPTQVKELHINLKKKGEIALLPRISELVNLSKISISDCPELEELPVGVLTLKKLRELYLSNLGIKSLPDDIIKLNELESIQFYKLPIEILPDSLCLLPDLKNINIQECELTALPENIGTLEILSSIKIYNSKLKKLPQSIGQLDILEVLELGNNNITELPDSVSELKSLKTLELNNNQLTEFPASVCGLPVLRLLYLNGNNISEIPKVSGMKALIYLNLNNNKFKVFPEEIYKLPKLETFSFEKNQLKSLPESLGSNAIKIDSLRLDGNPFEHFPYVLFDWYKLSKPKYWRFEIDNALYNKAKLFDLLDNKTFQNLNRATQINFFNIYCGLDKEIKKINLPQLWEALNSPATKVADLTLGFMTELQQAPIQQGSKIYIAGKTNKTLEEIKEQMTACGLELRTKLSPEVTHVLISARGNKKYSKELSENQLQWITEAQLTQYFDKINPTYLVEAADTDAEKVSDLIMTLDEDNMALAISLVEGGGLPESLFTEVYIVHKFSEQPEIAKKALALLKQKAGPELMTVLKSRGILNKKGYISSADKEELLRKLISYTKDSGLNRAKLAYALYKKTNTGLSYALDEGTTAMKNTIVASMIKNDIFETDYQTYLKYFPMELLQYPALKQLYISALNGQYTDDGWKDYNSFIIPEEIFKLTELESITIYGITFDTIPIQSFAKLKKLKTLKLIVSKDFDKNALYSMLPNCKVELV
jgi:hypothetical protein